MASPAYELILAVQALDLSVDQLRHRAASHPLRSDLAAIDEELATHDREVARLEERHHELDRQRKRLEDEAAMIGDRRRNIDGKLYGGEVTASKELLALQDEAATLLTKQNAIEDDELELMEQLETLEGDLDARVTTRASIQERRAGIQGQLDEALAEIEADIARTEGERAERATPAPGAPAGWDELLARYQDLRAQYDGVPVARLVDGRCDGCHIQLSAVAVDRMARMPDDAVVTCEECGRLLVR